MGDAVTDDFDRLLAAHLDDTLDAAETALFHQRLRTDVQARHRLLAASTQASALPRLGLEASIPRPIPAPRNRVWLPFATAAALMIGLIGGVAAWWSSSTAVAVRVAGVTAQVERDGVRQPGASLRVGDRLDNGDAPAVLTWPEEDTRIELAADSRLHVEQLGAHKVLRLDRGTLQAVVAQQGPGGGLVIITPHGRVEVVGTRFEVQVQDHASRIAVTHGSVRVVSAAGAAPVMLQAGYSTEVTSTAVSAPGPATLLPAVAIAPSPSTPTSPTQVRLTAADFRVGGEGVIVGDVVRGVPVTEGRVTRLTTPLLRPDGYVRLADGLRCTLRVTVDRPTTLALLLVCDHPSGGHAWVGNLQAERDIPAGTHQLTIARADLRLASGTTVSTGSRVVAASVMCWGAPADLRLEWLAFGE